MRLDEVRGLSLGEVEALYLEERPIAIPRGIFRGALLHWLPTHPRESRLLRPLLRVGFELTPFGVDFTRRRWFFGPDGAPRLGRFEPVVAPSRWRPTETVQLRYHRSRLPGPLRSRLYDEVKPLSDDLCLGIGGVDGLRGPEEHFFFVLTRPS